MSMTATVDIPEAATPGIGTPRASCPHWWAGPSGSASLCLSGVHVCAGRLFHADKHRCECGAEQSR